MACGFVASNALFPDQVRTFLRESLCQPLTGDSPPGCYQPPPSIVEIMKRSAFARPCRSLAGPCLTEGEQLLSFKNVTIALLPGDLENLGENPRKKLASFAKGLEKTDLGWVSSTIEDPAVKSVTRSFLVPSLGTREVHFGLKPHLVENERRAAEAMRQLLLQITQLSPREIVDKLLQIHRTLLQGSPVAGKFRETSLTILTSSPDSLKEKIRRQILDPTKQKRFLKYLKQAFEAPHENIDWEFPEEQEEFIKLIGAVKTPSQDKVPFLMEDFAAQLKETLQQQEICPQTFNPVATAAFAHMALIYIHGFADGNGRTARLVANAILTANGYSPLLTSDRKLYLSATWRDLDAHPRDLEKLPLGLGAVFADYLACIVQSQRLNDLLFSMPERSSCIVL